jgi:GNAT superfamily N-acetyltransferase
VVSFKQVTLTKEVKPLLHKMQKTCLPSDRVYFPSNGTYWIGYEADKPVAFCITAPSVSWADTVYLGRSGVMPSHRGHGLQKRMISIRERWARRKGYVWCITDTADNPASANSLISRGYRMFEPSKPWGLNCSVYWRKKLM